MDGKQRGKEKTREHNRRIGKENMTMDIQCSLVCDIYIYGPYMVIVKQIIQDKTSKWWVQDSNLH